MATTNNPDSPQTTDIGRNVADVTTQLGATTKAIQDTKPNYRDDRWKVGSGGFYWEEDDDGESHAKLVDKDGTEVLVDTSIDIGVMKKGNNITMSVEQGIADYVKELSDDENHLPNSKVGVMMYYLSKGIAEDFGVTWTIEPASLGGGRRGGGSAAGRKAGQRVMSKKDKNKLMDKLDLKNYQEDIQAGRITIEEAMEEMRKAFSKKAELEDMGYYLSPNKTEGVLNYNWKTILDKSYDDVVSITKGSAYYIYEKIEVLLPNIYQNYYSNDREHSNKKNCQELVKSVLKGTVMEDAGDFRVGSLKPNFDVKGSGGLSNEPINSEEDILKLIGHTAKGRVMGIHLAKVKKSGMMKPRWVVVDVFADGRQTLYLYDETSTLTLKNG